MTSTISDEQGLLRVPNNKYRDDNIVKSFKGRHIDLDKPVFLYRNLHTGGYSLRQNNLVVAHAERICLRDCEFIVNQKAREKVIDRKQRSVHAFVKGIFTTSGMGTTAAVNDLPAKIEYNPYKYEGFTCTNITIEPFLVKGARFCIADENGLRASYTNQ
jgi:hypothetical protein